MNALPDPVAIARRLTMTNGATVDFVGDSAPLRSLEADPAAATSFYDDADKAPFDTPLVAYAERDAGDGTAHRVRDYALCWRHEHWGWLLGGPADGYRKQYLDFEPARARILRDDEYATTRALTKWSTTL